mgnify:CR=1 FL=1
MSDMSDSYDAKPNTSISWQNPATQAFMIALSIWLTAAVVLALFYHQGRAGFLQEAATGLVRTAVNLASQVDGDLHRTLTDPAQESTPAYRTALLPLQRALAAPSSDIHFVYTAVLKGDEVHFVLDPSPPGDADLDGVDDHAYLMERYDSASPELLRALRDHVPTAEFATVIDKWGRFISGYAPIHDSAGNAVGILGIDVDAEKFFLQQVALRSDALLALAAATLLAVLTGILVYRTGERMQRAELARHTVANRLAQSEGKYRSIIENITDVICTTRFDHTVCYVSDSIARLGRTAEELHNRNLFEALCVENAAAASESMFRSLAETGEAGGIITMHQPDGETRYAEIKSRVVRDESGGGRLVTSVIRDITECTRLEDRLRQSEKLEAIGQLAGGIAHDFNNQIMGILGYSEILLEDVVDATLRQHCACIHRSALRARELVESLLSFSRKERRRSVPFSVHEAIAETARLLTPSLGNRIAIHLELDSRAPCIMGDPTQFQNALLNLGINARDAMPDGGTLTFRTAFAPAGLTPGAEPGGIMEREHLVITIADTGRGMDEMTRRRAFEPYFSTKAPGKGTGLGLASVSTTVAAHGGTISVDSAVGSGAVFTIRLPLAPEPDAAAPSTDTAINGSTASVLLTPAPEAVRAARIMVIDDEDAIGLLTEKMLTSLGHRVEAHLDPVQAIATYRQEWPHIDLVLLDMTMPVLGGREVFHALRTINPRVRIVLISGFAADADIQTLLEHGACGFIPKPFDKAALVHAVNAGLAGMAQR